MIHYYLDKECFWFRVLGYGLRFIDRSKVRPLFSIRNGYVKEYRIGKWGVILLKRGR
jgi:hypothetical protein